MLGDSMNVTYSKYDIATGVQKLKTRTGLLVSTAALLLSSGGGLSFALLGTTHADSLNGVNFESPAYVLGNINGQHGWSKTGPFDAAVVNNSDYGFTGLGSQSLRISNSKTSGSFSDQTYSPSLVNEAGETDALNNGYSGGVRQSHFEAQFTLASTTKADKGMALSVSPERGDGARMSYLRFEDQADGVHVFFDDVTDLTHVTNADMFNETDIATLSYASAHTVKFSMDLFNGPDNDVVKISLDGKVAATGTSWEDYYRYDTESNPTLANNSRTVDSLLFREAGDAVASNEGLGYLIDNVSLLSGASVPSDKDQCKNNGWKNYGATYKNQGDCVSFVASKGKN